MGSDEPADRKAPGFLTGAGAPAGAVFEVALAGWGDLDVLRESVKRAVEELAVEELVGRAGRLSAVSDICFATKRASVNLVAWPYYEIVTNEAVDGVKLSVVKTVDARKATVVKATLYYVGDNGEYVLAKAVMVRDRGTCYVDAWAERGYEELAKDMLKTLEEVKAE